MKLHMPDALEQRIREHGEETYPHECCGALLGAVDEAGKHVTEIASLANDRDDSPENRFLVTDRDYLRVEREADRRGLTLLGFYHSHPDHPARPSRYDLDHAFPWFSYVIVAIGDGKAGDFTSWVLAEDRSQFLPEDVARAPKTRTANPPEGGS